MCERDIERYLVKQVKAAGGEVRKVKWIGRRGAPDRIVMMPDPRQRWTSPGFSFWVELKAPGEEPPLYQVREHERMRRRGLKVYVVSSIKAVDKLLGIEA